MFSGFYIALLLLLVLLIVRVLSFEWREKSESPAWRRVWAWANAIGSVGASLIWGIALASLLHGVPLDSKGDFDGDFADLFTGYSVLAGVTVVLVFASHGATYLTIRTRGDLCDRAARAARVLSVAAVLVGSGFLAWTVAVAVDRNDKDVFPPVLPAALGACALVLALIFVYRSRSGLAFGATAFGAVLLVATLLTSLYPRVMVSSPDFANSLTVSGAASAHYTLKVISIVAAICLPVILVYQGWTYHVFRHRLGGDESEPGPPTPDPPGLESTA
jgi:cytochrome d ubiquinol oxidase subunit II